MEFQCKEGGATLFPARYFCPACGGAEWGTRTVECGRIAESTVVRHRIGAQAGDDVHLASVLTSVGPIVIARGSITPWRKPVVTVRLEIGDSHCVLAHER